MKGISTHVLDIARGQPAQDLAVRLERRGTSGNWVMLASARTDGDGRCIQLLPEKEPLHAGIYRLSFDTGSYHHAQKVEGLYPVVEITFEVHEGQSQFHIPLLFSPQAYMTYRGS